MGLLESDIVIALISAAALLALLTAHKYPEAAVGWMFKLLGISMNDRKVLVPAWIEKCRVDGSAEWATNSMHVPLAVGSCVSFQFADSVEIPKDSTLADVRKMLFRSAELRHKVPERYDDAYSFQ